MSVDDLGIKSETFTDLVETRTPGAGADELSVVDDLECPLQQLGVGPAMQVRHRVEIGRWFGWLRCDRVRSLKLHPRSVKIVNAEERVFEPVLVQTGGLIGVGVSPYASPLQCDAKVVDSTRALKHIEMVIGARDSPVAGA